MIVAVHLSYNFIKDLFDEKIHLLDIYIFDDSTRCSKSIFPE